MVLVESLRKWFPFLDDAPMVLGAKLVVGAVLIGLWVWSERSSYEFATEISLGVSALLVCAFVFVLRQKTS